MKKVIFIFCLFFSLSIVAQNSKKTDSKSPNSLGVFTFVETAPEFPGGDGEFTKFIERRLAHPKDANEKNIQGKVLLRFTIYEDGSVHDVTLLEKADPRLDAEAMRVVSLLPKFKPGYTRGKAVKVYFNLPIIFKLTD